MWLRVHAYAHKELSVLSTIGHHQKLDSVSWWVLVQCATSPTSYRPDMQECRPMLALLHVNAADHRMYGNLLGGSSSHTSHLWMHEKSRKIDCIWLRNRGGKWGTEWIVIAEEKIWMTFESRWFGTWFIILSKRELVPHSRQFYTMQYAFIFKHLPHYITDFQWVTLD